MSAKTCTRCGGTYGVTSLTCTFVACVIEDLTARAEKAERERDQALSRAESALACRESPTASVLLRRGGEWLGAAREWLQCHTLNGSEVDWGSADEIRPTFTVAMVEDLAATVAAAAMRPQPTEQRVEVCLRARWKAEAERDEAIEEMLRVRAERDAALERVKQIEAWSEADEAEVSREASFVYGQLALTSEYAEASQDQLLKLRERCEEAARSHKQSTFTRLIRAIRERERERDEALARAKELDEDRRGGWPTSEEGEVHTRLTSLVDKLLGSQPTMPVMSLISTLEQIFVDGNSKNEPTKDTEFWLWRMLRASNKALGRTGTRLGRERKARRAAQGLLRRWLDARAGSNEEAEVKHEARKLLGLE